MRHVCNTELFISHSDVVQWAVRVRTLSVGGPSVVADRLRQTTPNSSMLSVFIVWELQCC